MQHVFLFIAYTISLTQQRSLVASLSSSGNVCMHLLDKEKE